jgi:uncharacterized phage protein (TIGR01671 family)
MGVKRVRGTGGGEMREIKFRGKRLDNGEWVYGDTCHHDGVVSYIGQHPDDGSMIIYDLIPEIVGEYTGLKDKNGTEIYEGDIVRAYGKLYRVEFSLGTFNFYGIGKTKYVLDWRSVANNSEDYRAWDKVKANFEVIGNVFDNPELIQEAEK